MIAEQRKECHAATWSCPRFMQQPLVIVLGALSAGITAAQTPTVTTEGRNGTMQITRGGSQASRPAPPEDFTGAVRIDPLFPVRQPSRVSAGSVTFEPGARTAWHTHPLGQTLIITSGFVSLCIWNAHRGRTCMTTRALVFALSLAMTLSDV